MQKTTLFLVLVALGLGGYVYFFEIQSNFPSEQTVETETNKGLFPFAESQVETITIEREQGETLKFIRLETAESSWRMKQPEGFPAKESAIAFLLDLLFQDSNPKKFTVEAEELDTYGLKNPVAAIELALKDNTIHRVVLGNPTFDEQQIYAQIDPFQNQEIDIYILPIDFQYAVERPLSQWKQPPPPELEETEENESPSPESNSEETESETSSPSSSEEED